MLTAKQQRFVDEYSVDRNASRAARAAGYSAVSAKVTACRLLTKANVQAALTVREREAQRALGASRESVIRELQEAIEIARAQGNPAAMIAGWREIAKICGFYQVRHEVQLQSNQEAEAFRAKFEALTDDALIRFIKHHG